MQFTVYFNEAPKIKKMLKYHQQDQLNVTGAYDKNRRNLKGFVVDIIGG